MLRSALAQSLRVPRQPTVQGLAAARHRRRAVWMRPHPAQVQQLEASELCANPQMAPAGIS